MDINEIQRISQQIYPNGRAFRMPEPIGGDAVLVSEAGDILVAEDGVTELIAEETLSNTSGGIFYRIQRSINNAILDAANDAQGILDALMPDNPNFTIDDARTWYRRLGLYDSGMVSLGDMKKGIAQKQSFPLVPLNKQNELFIQQQLQAAGFDVYVYKNRFAAGGGYITYTPSMAAGAGNTRAISGYIQSGQGQYGQTSGNVPSVAVSYLEPEKDATFDVTNKYRSVLYISGNPITTFASVPAAREQEFRQLVIKLKTAETIAVLFVNYI